MTLKLREIRMDASLPVFTESLRTLTNTWQSAKLALSNTYTIDPSALLLNPWSYLRRRSTYLQFLILKESVFAYEKYQ